MSDVALLPRERFVENALLIGLTLACEGNDQDNLDFRGGLREGAIDCNNGQGSDFLALWNPRGVVVLAHDHDRYERQLPAFPDDLRPLLESVSLDRFESATGGLWILGATVTTTLEKSESGRFLAIIDQLCGPSLFHQFPPQAPQRALLNELLRGASTITAELARIVLRSEIITALMRSRESSALDAARVVARCLSRFGFEWPHLESHVAERWPPSP